MFKSIIIITLAILSQLSHASPSNELGPTDPYLPTNYSRAFDVTVLKPFQDVLDAEGISIDYPDQPRSCGQGLCSSVSSLLFGPPDSPYETAPSHFSSYEEYIGRRALMEKALLDQLHAEKSRASWRPATNSAIGVVTILPVSAAGYEAGSSLPPAQQALTLWPLMDTIMEVGKCLRAVAGSCFNSAYPANDALLRLEEKFALRVPYATAHEWVLIETAFATQRASRNYVTDDLEVRIALIKSKKLSPSEFARNVGLANSSDTDDWRKRVRDQLAEYFSNYEDSGLTLKKITGAVIGYADQFISGRKSGAYTLLLQGPFGTGKSHFAGTLKNLLSDLLGEDFPMALVSYTSVEDLLGTENRPGAILTSLAKISQEYGIIFLDEGNLDQLDKIGKLLFDSGGTDYPFPFLKGGTRSLRNYLVVVCSNHPISDPAISSRVVKVDYPRPSRDLVSEVAMNLMRKALPAETTSPLMREYFEHPLIQKIVFSENQLRLRDQINEAIVAIDIEADYANTESKKTEWMESISAQYGEHLANTFFVRNLLNDSKFWKEAEPAQWKAVADAVAAATAWLEKL